jgi:EmrB/QacA subfamily drug resistance transporter
VTSTASPDLRRRSSSGHHDHVHPNLALAVIASAQLMVVLDATIVNIALPHMQRALHFSNTNLAWVLNSYTLVFGGLLLLGGRAGDLFGRRRMFMAGVLIFALASLAGGFAWDQGWLLAMRALQGVGGAIASPTALALVTTTFEEGPARNRAFGVYAAVSGAGAAIGLILGGVLTEWLSWRWVFFVNAPIGIALAAATPLVLTESSRARIGRLALTDALTSTLGMGALVYGFIHAASTQSWTGATTIGSFVLAALLLTVFVVMQARSAQPLMPLRLFHNPTRVGAYTVMLIVGAAVFAMFFFLTQYVQKVMGFSPIKAGFAFLPVSAMIIVVAQVASRLVTKVPGRVLIAGGTLFAGVGLLYLSRLDVGSSYSAHVLPAILLIAVGMGMTFVPITLAAVTGVEAEDTGIASAMLNVGQQVGGTIGLAGLVTVFGHASRSYVQGHLRDFPPAQLAAHAFTHGADMAFLAGAILAAIGFVAAVSLIKISRDDVKGAPGIPG